MTQSVLHTIGYEGISIGDFLATLELIGIDLVIDVRCVPLSRKPGFSKSILARWLACRDIQYLHLKELGEPKEGRIAAREGAMAISGGYSRRIYKVMLPNCFGGGDQRCQ